jgi:hypothetical protein
MNLCPRMVVTALNAIRNADVLRRKSSQKQRSDQVGNILTVPLPKRNCLTGKEENLGTTELLRIGGICNMIAGPAVNPDDKVGGAEWKKRKSQIPDLRGSDVFLRSVEP